MKPLDYRPPSEGGRPALRLAIALGLLLTVGLAAGALLLPAEHLGEGTEPVAGPAQRPPFSATLTAHLPSPGDLSLSSPVAVAAVGGRLFLTDSTGAIVEMDADGTTHSVWSVPGLQKIRALAVDGGQLLAASALTSQVFVLRADGSTAGTLRLPPTFDGAPAIPSGLAHTPDGHLYVADVVGRRLLVLDDSGAVLQAFGGERDGPRYLLDPGAMTVAPDGTVFLADRAAGRVYRVTDGLPFPSLEEGAHPGAQVYEPRALAADAQGRLYVADALLKDVQVFAGDGTYLGQLSSSSPDDPALQEPLALFAEGRTLYVVDASQGLLVYDLP